MIKIVTNSSDFNKYIQSSQTGLVEVERAVRSIINKVREEGEDGLLELRQRFDGVPSARPLRVQAEEINQAYQMVDDSFRRALQQAKENIYRFHRKQERKTWFSTEESGPSLGQLIRPIDRVGIYVPGGTATYPSSVLMNAIPARVAGVKEIAMVTPPDRDGNVPAPTLVAAAEVGITEIYRVGGAHAIAALAYGTRSIKPVDKITGPGNAYVTLAKKQVYGQVGIDMLAGPSEILVVADGNANARFAAADLLSQAEHDVLARPLMVTDSAILAAAVREEIERQLKRLSRQDIARQSIDNHGVIFVENDWENIWQLVNAIAPEHLELLVVNPMKMLGRVRHAGAVFLGPYSPEPVGDYVAGPNHVLPTGGTARFYSPLNVDTFIKKSSVISFSKKDLVKEAENIISLARVEGLDAHARAVQARLEED
ncbi:histidinol dehydrogenase [Metallumcola ferriviriculae]|uniref:Histidinol dehydrogenase n=1 Tax=Metallumcola ferriviriculae TaxID=3039180 RepID=A0AAU0UT32_9FIRM|nr:histidinol dehydrogenase [Desulfitibacteraceae bacterium MK1]